MPKSQPSRFPSTWLPRCPFVECVGRLERISDFPSSLANLDQDGVWRCFQRWGTLGMIKL